MRMPRLMGQVAIALLGFAGVEFLLDPNSLEGQRLAFVVMCILLAVLLVLIDRHYSLREERMRRGVEIPRARQTWDAVNRQAAYERGRAVVEDEDTGPIDVGVVAAVQ